MSVKVAVRCRPLSEDEKRENSKIVVRMSKNEVQVMNCMAGHGANFVFDEALWSAGVQVDGGESPHISQEDVYKPVACDLMNHIVTGYNGCIFAYGQTGSGKTYSMIGTPTDVGLVPRIAKNIFLETEALTRSGIEVLLEVSYFEIYNEQVRCLLRPTDVSYENSPLRVREHPTLGPFIEGLAKFVLSSETALLQLMNDGNRVRTTGSTLMNASSSRSHAIFALTLTQKRTDGSVLKTKTSRLNLVDLAGSERASKTMATGKRLVEGANINKSLACLGNVISRLAENRETGRKRHIPYRDSVLTWILQENLGGNSKTVMLATISPSEIQYEETMSTLRYADRVKKIVNRAVVNESSNNELIAALQKEIEGLKTQLCGASEIERVRLSDELKASEAIQKELQMSFEEKLAETGRMMVEREKYMCQLEERLEAQKDEINNLRNDNMEKEQQIEKLLQHITEVRRRLGSQDNPELERLLEQVAVLEMEKNKSLAQHTTSSNATSSRVAKDTTLRSEDLGNVRPVQLNGNRVTVLALAKAFESIGLEQQTHSAGCGSRQISEVLYYDPVALQVSAYENKMMQGEERQLHPRSDGTFSELRDKEKDTDLKHEQLQSNTIDYANNRGDEYDESLDLDINAQGDEDILLDDEDILLDDEGILLDDEEEVDDELELEMEEDKEYIFDTPDKRATTEEREGAEEESEGIELDSESDNDIAVDDKEKNVIVSEVYDESVVACGVDNHEITEGHGCSKLSVNSPEETCAAGNVTTLTADAAADVVAVNVLPTSRTISPSNTLTTLVVPSHSLPNNRYLHEPFKVIKRSDAVLAGGKKDRIWDVDFFRRRFANLDMSGYASFEFTAANLYRVERDPFCSKRLTLYFFEAAHPYKLEFTSTHRRQRFYELAMTLRRNSIMWCPSLCLESDNDVILNVHGTTIERPNSVSVKVSGETNFMVTRMPYEIVDMWYGCLSLKNCMLPRSTAVLGSFLPRESHEVYVIGIMDFSSDVMGGEDLSRYFLTYLGLEEHYVLANTSVCSKKKTNNVIIIIVRRSFVLRTSHIEAMESVPVYKDEIAKGDFTGVGCALRINETSIGIILANAKQGNHPVLLHTSCLRALMSSFPLGDSSIDIRVRFDYFIVSGAFNLGADFTDEDMLLSQIKSANLMSDMLESKPSATLINSSEPLRIFYAVRPRVCRLDVKQYTTSRALAAPNAFISTDIFCQRPFLSVFGEKVQRVQLVLDDLVISSPSRRFPALYYPELCISGEWIDNSPLVASLSNSNESYTLSRRAVPIVAPTISNMDFLRLQTIKFSFLGLLNPSTGEKKSKTKSEERQQHQPLAGSVIASAVLPLKDLLEMGKVIDFSVPMYYQTCLVGTLTGTLLLVAYERDDADIPGLQSEHDVAVVSCYENQILDGKNWVPTVFSQHHAYSFSKRDVTVECSRESYSLPDPTKWVWLNTWRHDVLPHDTEGWMYGEGFDQPFRFKLKKVSTVRRRRWTRAMQASDPITLHNYLMLLRANPGT